MDVDELSKRYINRFSGVTYAECLEAANAIRQADKSQKINYGSGVSSKGGYAV